MSLRLLRTFPIIILSGKAMIDPYYELHQEILTNMLGRSEMKMKKSELGSLFHADHGNEYMQHDLALCQHTFLAAFLSPFDQAILAQDCILGGFDFCIQFALAIHFYKGKLVAGDLRPIGLMGHCPF